MGTDRAVGWASLDASALPDVAALARRVLAADGGHPLIADEALLARRYTGDGVLARAARGEDGSLVAVVAVRRPASSTGSAANPPVATGMVDPTRRGRGLGAAALDWALATARSAGAGPMTVETESLTDSAAALFASRGLRQVFAEDVMRLDLAAEPPPAVLELAVPAGVTLHTWRPELVGRFFGVYRAAFRDRPGFPGWSQAQWAEWIFGDEEFRPEWSVLAVAAGDEAAPGSAGATSGSAEAAPGGDDVGFIGCADGWIVQVGVRPDRRGRGLGAALVGEALRRMRDGGLREAFLDVNVDNPAARLYVRLGFEVLGRRARFSVAG